MFENACEGESNKVPLYSRHSIDCLNVTLETLSPYFSPSFAAHQVILLGDKPNKPSWGFAQCKFSTWGKSLASMSTLSRG